MNAIAPAASRQGLAIEYRPLKALVPYARNARTHPRKQLDKIKASLAEFGWMNPILVADGGVIAGHGRREAAMELAAAGVPIPGNADPDLAPTVDVSRLSPAQRKAYVLADNRIALDSGWDEEMLAMEFGELKLEYDFDLALTGFDDEDIDKIIGDGALAPEGEGGADPDDVPSVPKHPVSRTGDLWVLGRHRLLCGDSTDPSNVERLMAGRKAGLCFTSPPYGQQRQYECGGISDWDSLMQGVFALLPLEHDAQVLVNLGLIHRDNEWIPYWDPWIQWMRDAGWRRFSFYVWDQGWGLPGDRQGRFAPSHEFIFHFNKVAVKVNYSLDKKPENIRDKSGEKTVYYEDRALAAVNYSPKSALNPKKIPDTVVRVTRHTGTLGDAGHHPAMFPVALAHEMHAAFTAEGDLVFEPFSGGGSQLIAAEKNGRACYGMELSDKYVDVCVKRWQQVTGLEAVLEGDGRTFAEVSAARPVPEAALDEAAADFAAAPVRFDDADVSLEDLL